jgi:UDP-N-acetylglucosamine pyrophosphorylase
MTDFEKMFKPFEDGMRRAGQSEPAILAFRRNFEKALGEPAYIRESEIEPLTPSDVASYEKLDERPLTSRVLSETLVLKLNGGLGTTMGLEGPKSLLKAKGNHTFLDLIVGQIQHLRRAHRDHVRLMFLNSFNTSAETISYLRQKHPKFATEPDLEIIQNKIPKIAMQKDAGGKTLYAPVDYPNNPELEWGPPGHGDLYLCLWQNGALDRLLQSGLRFMFISNADNLGATLDPALLHYFASSKHDFLMEVAERTKADQKGGHLARRIADREFVLRELAQCHDEDKAAFQDIRRHRYFNTNNLWIRLDRLQEKLASHRGLVPLPVIKNKKHVDPADKKSQEVLQLETACGAAISCFKNAGAVVVPRTRFLPVKTHDDLELIRSDRYEVTEDYRLVAKS